MKIYSEYKQYLRELQYLAEVHHETFWTGDRFIGCAPLDVSKEEAEKEYNDNRCYKDVKAEKGYDTHYKNGEFEKSIEQTKWTMVGKSFEEYYWIDLPESETIEEILKILSENNFALEYAHDNDEYPSGIWILNVEYK